MEEKKKKMPKWLIVVIVILVIAVIGGLAGGGDTSTGKDNDTKDNNTVETTEKKELTLEDGWSGSLDEYGAFYYVNGYIKNDTGKDYEYVQVEFTSYDADGNTLGTCVDNQSGLKDGGRWAFKASCIDSPDKVAKVELKEITGY